MQAQTEIPNLTETSVLEVAGKVVELLKQYTNNWRFSISVLSAAKAAILGAEDPSGGALPPSES